ncbi:hypothetical protein [Umezawaea sp. Da 62-37]|uniref:hypothetical protein n=1 Tax=Umezawaea sp. Da 62-37 TaxID=3075927 RepID=UPI0028F6FBBC|nr:hypothetical protein [Umezawaea sp. Da 62-37]WNV85175.1 hypothetical protein RM788_44750 [Umezawaea sp. Da 62-37]
MSSLLAGCTADPVEPAQGAVPATAEVITPSTALTVLDVDEGGASAIAVSAALFRSAPVVVVTVRSDVAGASAVGERIGAPVLLAPAVGSSDALRAELTRLSPRALLAVGAGASAAVEASASGVPVFTADSTTSALPDGLPDTSSPAPVGVTVLVDAARDDAAAIATARAAGARVVPVNGYDPRADQAAVQALREEPSKIVLAVGAGFAPVERLRARLAVASRGVELPGGGQVLFPGRRLVCLYGHPGTPALGVLGEQGVEEAVARARELATRYEPLSGVPVVPAFELIATVAQGSPGPDGDYSGEASVESLRPWVDAAGKAGLYVVLDLQPGRARLLDQARRYAPLLGLPHVGLAVDPEWKLGPDQVPLKQIGGMDAAEINETAQWLADLTARTALPQKLLVVHQFRLSMIRDEPSLVTDHDELAVLIHMDGQGTTGQKTATWNSVVAARPDEGVPLGWKNFYDEDHPMLTPEQTMGYRPTPTMISYQ